MFLFESILTEQQDQMAVSRGDIALGLIAVYRSLGGGWQIRCDNGKPGDEIIQAPAWEGEEIPAPESPRRRGRVEPRTASNGISVQIDGRNSCPRVTVVEVQSLGDPSSP